MQSIKYDSKGSCTFNLHEAYLRFLFLFVLMSQSLSGFSQISVEQIEQEEWNLRVYSIENFINKFNGTLDIKNNSIEARNSTSRIQTLLHLINLDMIQQAEDSIRMFVLASLKNENKLLFSSNDWYAEVEFNGSFRGKNEIITAIFTIHTEKNDSYQWSLINLRSKSFGTTGFNAGLVNFPPNSHGNDFISIPKLFQSKVEKLNSISAKDVDMKSVKSVTYHFFHVKNWYFSVTEFDRRNQLSGWLIKNIIYLSDSKKADKKRKIISLNKY